MLVGIVLFCCCIVGVVLWNAWLFVLSSEFPAVIVVVAVVRLSFMAGPVVGPTTRKIKTFIINKHNDLKIFRFIEALVQFIYHSYSNNEVQNNSSIYTTDFTEMQRHLQNNLSCFRTRNSGITAAFKTTQPPQTNVYGVQFAMDCRQSNTIPAF